MSSPYAQAFFSLPPITRTITALSIFLSVLTWVLHIINPYYLVYISQTIFTYKSVPQIWRPITSLLLTKPNWGLLMDPYFLFVYGSKLESEAERFQHGRTGTADFMFFIVFCSAVIIFLAGHLLSSPLLLSSLTASLVYLSSVTTPDAKVSFIFFTVKARYLPWLMLVSALVMGGMAGPEQVLIEGTGIVAAHLYIFLNDIWPTYGSLQKHTASRWLTTPDGFVRFVDRFVSLVGGKNAGRPGDGSMMGDKTVKIRNYGTAFNGGGGAGSSSNTSSSNASTSKSTWTSPWNSRGAGHRLGGE